MIHSRPRFRARRRLAWYRGERDSVAQYARAVPASDPVWFGVSAGLERGRT